MLNHWILTRLGYRLQLEGMLILLDHFIVNNTTKKKYQQHYQKKIPI